MPETLRITVLGSGTSSGVPMAVYSIMPGITEPGTRGPVTGVRLANASCSP